ncbi:MAG TPA: ankyrin repeat domain-containing protein [Bryobacteraceae bacterium]|nr:ankyrin repeat domain-containing protein [Bryobacteraceae bacterium]
MKKWVWVWLCISGELSFAQVSAKIDFRRDVQPLFREQCTGCHGPTQQMNGFRLDQRRYVMPNRIGANGAAVAPGNSAKSLLYLKLTGSQNGPRMPPAGPLSPKQIEIVKAWIDQGAEWPDSLSGETPLSSPDPEAARLMEAIRSGDRQRFQKMLRRNAKAANRRGPGGSTPLMYAALYGDADSVQLLLKSGADPNARNDAGATALMWAVEDPEKTRLLLRQRADVNARSADGQTPLIIAAGHFGAGAEVTKLLLEAGANLSERASDGNTPLGAATFAADDAVIEVLIAHGAAVNSAGVYSPARAGCGKCVARLMRAAEGKASNPMVVPTPAFAYPPALKMLLDHGAGINVNARGGRVGMTGLMFAAISDAFPVEAVRDLIERGADVNLKNSHGLTALDLARRLGDSPVADLLVKAGAKEGGASAEPVPPPIPQPKPAVSLRAAIARSIPLAQRSDVTFVKKSGCVSCHNNNLTAMAVAAVRRNDMAVDEETARKQLKVIASYLETWRERLLQGKGIPGNQDTVSYILLGMAAENYGADAATDAAAHYLKSRQAADGHWWVQGPRSPLESSDIQVTAVSMRAIQAYSPKARRAEYERRAQLAAGWLVKAEARTNEDRTFQLLGLRWAKASKETIRKAAGELLAEQRADGGWAQIRSLASDAYATGQALVALHESGAVAVTDAAYQRGARFLLNTQLEDGSWYVKSRSLAFQPYFESDFPHGHDQWISAAATNWAVMALAPAAR